MRRNLSDRAFARLETASVLASPGTPSRSTCPPVRRPISSRSTIAFWPTTARATSSRTRESVSPARSIRRADAGSTVMPSFLEASGTALSSPRNPASLASGPPSVKRRGRPPAGGARGETQRARHARASARAHSVHRPIRTAAPASPAGRDGSAGGPSPPLPPPPPPPPARGASERGRQRLELVETVQPVDDLHHGRGLRRLPGPGARAGHELVDAQPGQRLHRQLPAIALGRRLEPALRVVPGAGRMG